MKTIKTLKGHEIIDQFSRFLFFQIDNIPKPALSCFLFRQEVGGTKSENL